MDDFLAVLAIFISCISGYLVFDLFYTGFSWAVLFSAIGGFILVHIIWPKKHMKTVLGMMYLNIFLIFHIGLPQLYFEL